VLKDGLICSYLQAGWISVQPDGYHCRKHLLILALRKIQVMKTSTKMLALAGVATGGTLGLLLAPQKGAVTRKKLARDLNRAAALLNGNRKKEKLQMVKEKLETQRQRLDELIQHIKTKLAMFEASDAGTDPGSV